MSYLEIKTYVNQLFDIIDNYTDYLYEHHTLIKMLKNVDIIIKYAYHDFIINKIYKIIEYNVFCKIKHNKEKISYADWLTIWGKISLLLKENKKKKKK